MEEICEIYLLIHFFLFRKDLKVNEIEDTLVSEKTLALRRVKSNQMYVKIYSLI